MRISIALALLVAAGCGGSGTTSPVDSGAPPDLADTGGCHPPFGRSYIVTTFAMRQEGDGFDLNGDGKPDNALGALATFANPKWQDAITNGYAIYLFDLRNLAGPPLVEGDHPALSFFVGSDADTDASNNLGGMGQFLVPAEQFDVNCQSTAGFDMPTVTGGQILAQKDSVSVVAQGVGSLQFVDVKLVSTMNADYSVFSGTLGDISTACALSLSPSGVSASSLLDVIVGSFSLQPDIDINGDGLDTFTGDQTNGVTSCTAADGTIIMGHDCACNPKIHDGYSAAFDFSSAPATILGLTPQP